MKDWLNELVEAFGPGQTQVRGMALAFKKVEDHIMDMAVGQYLQDQEDWPRPMDLWPYVRQARAQMKDIMASQPAVRAHRLKPEEVKLGQGLGDFGIEDGEAGPVFHGPGGTVVTFFQPEEGGRGAGQARRLPTKEEVLEDGHPQLTKLSESFRKSMSIREVLARICGPEKPIAWMEDLGSLLLTTAGTHWAEGTYGDLVERVHRVWDEGVLEDSQVNDWVDWWGEVRQAGSHDEVVGLTDTIMDLLKEAEAKLEEDEDEAAGEGESNG